MSGAGTEPSSMEEAGLIGDFLCGELDLKRLHECVRSAGLEPCHFSDPEARKAFEVIAANRDVLDAAALRDIVRRSKAATQRYLEKAVGNYSILIKDACDRIRNVSSIGHYMQVCALAKSLQESGFAPAARKLFHDSCTAIMQKMEMASACEVGDAVPLSEFVRPPKEQEADETIFRNGWLRKKKAGMLVSVSGSGKSVISMQFAFAWALGRPMFGIEPTRPLKIGIFQSEDDDYDLDDFFSSMERGFKKYHGWTDGDFAAATRNVLLPAWNGESGLAFVARLRAALEHELDQGKPPFDLIIVNPLLAFFGGNLSSQESVTPFLRGPEGLDSVIKDPRLRCALLFVHHTGKPASPSQVPNFGTNEYAQYVGFGSSDIQNYVRAILNIVPVRGKKGVYNLKAAKRGERLNWPEGDMKTIRHAQQGPDFMFWLEGESDPGDQPSSAAPTLEDDVRALAAELQKHTKTSLTEARKMAIGMFSQRRGNAAHAALISALNNPKSVHYGLELKPDKNVPQRKYIIPAE